MSSLTEAMQLLGNDFHDFRWARAAFAWGKAASMTDDSSLQELGRQRMRQAFTLVDVGSAPVETFEWANELGVQSAANEDWEDAVRYLEFASSLADQMYTDSAGHSSHQLELLQNVGNVARLAAYALAKVGSTERAVELVERTRGRTVTQSSLDFEGVAALGSSVRPVIYVLATPWGSLCLIVWSDALAVHVESVFGSLTSGEVIAELAHHTPKGFKGFVIEQGAGGAFGDALSGIADLMGEGLLNNLSIQLRRLRARHLLVVPCGPLNLLPISLATLQSETGEKSPLLNHYTVSTFPSAAALARSTSDRDGHQTSIGHITVVVRPNRPELPDLPGAEVEARAISVAFGEERVHLLSGAKATRSAVASALANEGIVHLACHGHNDPFNPGSSSVSLADGELTLDVVRFEVDITARLVVASACQTGAVSLFVLPDEALGLSAGLLVAGARCVVAALWPVSDYATGLLMSKFYEKLAKATQTDGIRPWLIAELLREAQLWLRDLTLDEEREYLRGRPRLDHDLRGLPTNSSDHNRLDLSLAKKRRSGAHARPFSDPVFWAPFIVIGS